MKFGTLKRFSKDIHPHIVSRTVAKVNFTILIVMLNEEIFCLNVFCSCVARNVTVFFKGKSAHVFLENNIGRYRVALCLKEMTCPKDITQFIIHCNIATSLDSVEYLVLSFCLFGELLIAPVPKVRMAPVWLWQSS
jgi:hypothetical protein